MERKINRKKWLTICKLQDRYFDWQSNERGVIFSSFYWAYILTQFLGGILAKKYGGNLVCSLQHSVFDETLPIITEQATNEHFNEF